MFRCTETEKYGL